MPELLFLDPDKHPFIVVGKKGRQVARFSNLPCAVRTVVETRHKKGGKVYTPEGDVLDSQECLNLVTKDRWWLGLSKTQSTGVVAA